MCRSILTLTTVPNEMEVKTEPKTLTATDVKHVKVPAPVSAKESKNAIKNGWTINPTPKSDNASPINNTFAGALRSECDLHIDKITRTLVRIALTQSGTFKRAFTTNAVLKG